MGETIKMRVLKDMVPEAVRQVIRQQKPNTFDKLKQVLKDEAKEHRDVTNAKKLRSKGLHVAEGERWGPRPEDAPNDQSEAPLFVWNAQLNSFVPAPEDADEQMYAWDMNLFRAEAKRKARAKDGRRRAEARAMDGNQKVVAKEKGMGAREAIGEKEEKELSSRELPERRRRSSTVIAIIVMRMVIGNEAARYSTKKWQLDVRTPQESIPERRVKARDEQWRCRRRRGIPGMLLRVPPQVVRPACFFLCFFLRPLDMMVTRIPKTDFLFCRLRRLPEKGWIGPLSSRGFRRATRSR